MPAPPPPPPMAPAAPPPPVFSMPKDTGNERGALLKSIRQGAKLKKTITNDKSAPAIAGKVGGSAGNKNGVKSVEASPSFPGTIPANGLGGLFAGGMPKLKPTGKLGTSPNSSNKSVNNNEVVTPPVVTPTKNFNSIQIELKKQLASDNRNRGPPPPAPNRIMSGNSNSQRQPFAVKDNVTNGLHLSQLSLNANSSSLHSNSSTLHRKAKSNANISLLENTDDVNNGFTPTRSVISHGKPNLAPKPPTLNGKLATPQKRNGKPISRAHSMRTPRSPSPQSPDTPPANKFGTVRHMSSIISQSLSNAAVHNQRLRPAISSRPSAPPPSIPASPVNIMSPTQQVPPPPPKINAVRHPNQAPPPPPPALLPQAPNHAPPPPPPHKTQPIRQPILAPTNNVNPPPPPPPRHSSMRDTPTTIRGIVDLDEKFKSLFQSPEKFPPPPPYKNVLKIYSFKQEVSLKSGV